MSPEAYLEFKNQSPIKTEVLSDSTEARDRDVNLELELSQLSNRED